MQLLYKFQKMSLELKEYKNYNDETASDIGPVNSDVTSCNIFITLEAEWTSMWTTLELTVRFSCCLLFRCLTAFTRGGILMTGWDQIPSEAHHPPLICPLLCFFLQMYFDPLLFVRIFSPPVSLVTLGCTVVARRQQRWGRWGKVCNTTTAPLRF